MAQNITLMGANYPDVPAVELPKTGGGTAKFTDVTGTTATAPDVLAGKYFFNSNGILTLGTGTGGGGTGGITQDQDGYLVLDPEGGGGGGGTTGLEYETGTWIPSSDITTKFTINFANNHSVPPFFFAIFYADESALVTERTAVGDIYLNTGQVFTPFTYGTEGTSIIYGYYTQIYSANTAPTTGIGAVASGGLFTPYNDQTSSDVTNSRYWATETGISAYTGSRAWKANTVYKWIAVWAPTT